MSDSIFGGALNQILDLQTALAAERAAHERMKERNRQALAYAYDALSRTKRLAEGDPFELAASTVYLLVKDAMEKCRAALAAPEAVNGELEQTKERVRVLVDVVRAAEQYVDCGDNSCRFKARGGMRTNGGCRCADRPLVMASLAKLYRAAQALAAPEAGGEK